MNLYEPFGFDVLQLGLYYLQLLSVGLVFSVSNALDIPNNILFDFWTVCKNTFKKIHPATL